MVNPDSSILVSAAQLSNIFSISEFTIQSLVNDNKIPYTFSLQSDLRFNLQDISDWLKSESVFMILDDDTLIDSFQKLFQSQFPAALRALRSIDQGYSAAKKHKGFNLVKIPNKKFGFLYYVRYSLNGKMIPSKWNTHTNILQDAVSFAQNNRDRIIASYFEKHQYADTIYSILQSYFRKNSSYLAIDEKRNRVLSEKTRSVYCHFITNVFIPFLHSIDVKCFPDITPPVISNFQNHLLCKGNKPQTVNRYIGCIKIIFSHLLMTGVIKSDVFEQVKMLRVKTENYALRGCHEIETVQGVFNSEWNNNLSYLLCLIIYSTGLRNSEIERIQVKDLIEIEGCHFIDVRKSKTKNGVRMVPLHDFVYRKLFTYITDGGKTADDYLFSNEGKHNQSTLYLEANREMGGILGISEAALDEMKISFYSGRHYWKTVMNAGGLGADIEEYFMGHKVSKDVSVVYNHRDKQGKKKLAVTARRVFAILDKYLFKQNTE